MLLLIILTLFFGSGLAANEEPQTKSAVTNHIWGRLGNNLISYLRGKWIAKKHQLKFLYTPFTLSDQFAFHANEKYPFDELNEFYPYTKNFNEIDNIEDLMPGTLVELSYKRFDLDLEWQTPEFRSFARELIKPRFPLNTITPPKETLSVLLHVRTGGGYDTKKAKLKYTAKFLSIDFYIKALDKLSAHFGHPEIYAFIITDDDKPFELAQQFKEKLSHRSHISYHWREIGGHDVNVLDDFFSIPNFDCLIRADSTFSIVASLLGDFKAIVTPKKNRAQPEKVDTNEINIIAK